MLHVLAILLVVISLLDLVLRGVIRVENGKQTSEMMV